VRDSDDLLLRQLGSFRLKGKAEPISVYEILGHRDAGSGRQVELSDIFAEGLTSFLAKDWPRAAGLFESILARFGQDGPSNYYSRLCQKYSAEPPPEDWTGVIQMQEK
jgi:adenylate cyclase